MRQTLFNIRAACRPNLAIDLGTAFTRAFGSNGILVETPSLVRQRVHSGNERKDIEIHALKDGFVRHFSAATTLLQPILQKMRRFRAIKPHVLACTPSTASEKQKTQLMEVILESGASTVDLVPEPFAGALGAGVDISSEFAQLVVDVGEGITDLAVLREGSLLHPFTFPLACGQMYESLRDWVLRSKGEWISIEVARQLVHSHDLDSYWCVTREEVLEVINPMLATVARKINDYMKKLPDDIACQIIEDGVTVTGGGATLPGLIEKIKLETHLDVRVPNDPSRTVIRGAASLL